MAGNRAGRIAFEFLHPNFKSMSVPKMGSGNEASQWIEKGKEYVSQMHESILKIVVESNFENLELLCKNGHDLREVGALAEELARAVKDTGILDRTEKLQYVEYQVRQKIKCLMAPHLVRGEEAVG